MSSYDAATAAQRELMHSNTGVSIEFWDAAGSRWYRSRGGILHHLTDGLAWQRIEGVPDDYDAAEPPSWMRRREEQTS